MADANTTALRYAVESVWGTTPNAPLKQFRYTGESLEDQKTVTESQEIIATRDLRDALQTARSSQGDVSFELAFGAHDDLIEVGLCSAWASDRIANGVAKKSVTLEKQITDVSNAFMVSKGNRVNTLNLNFPLGGLAAGSIGFMGKRLVPAAATAGNGSFTAAPTTSPISTIDFSTEEGGSPLAGVTEFTLALNNNLRSQGELGNVDPFGIGLGSFRLTGTLVVYFQSVALINKYDSHDASAITVVVGDEDDNEYTFRIPRLRYGSARVVAEGLNGDVLARLGWTAILDPSSGAMFEILRQAGS